jgi:hypothetical protein
MEPQVEVNKTMLVVVSLYDLGGEADLEHIAVKAHELFPQQFCWQSFPQFPDKDAVRVHLSEAKKKSVGALVIDGSDLRHRRNTQGKGYTKRYALTRAGVDKARELSGLLQRGTRLAATKKSLEYARVVAPLVKSEAFERFRGGQSVEQLGRDAYLEAFSLFPDTSPFVITGRINRASVAVRALGDTDRAALEKFIEEGRNAFGF